MQLADGKATCEWTQEQEVFKLKILENYVMAFDSYVIKLLSLFDFKEKRPRWLGHIGQIYN